MYNESSNGNGKSSILLIKIRYLSTINWSFTFSKGKD